MRFGGSRQAAFNKRSSLHEENKADNKKNRLEALELKIESDFDQKYKSNIANENEIVMRRIPYIFWFFGILAIIIGIYLLYSLIVGPTSKDKLFSGLDRG